MTQITKTLFHRLQREIPEMKDRDPIFFYSSIGWGNTGFFNSNNWTRVTEEIHKGIIRSFLKIKFSQNSSENIKQQELMILNGLLNSKDRILALTLCEIDESSGPESLFALKYFNVSTQKEETLINLIDFYNFLPTEYAEIIRKDFYEDSSRYCTSGRWRADGGSVNAGVLLGARSLSKYILINARKENWKQESFDTTVKILNEVFAAYLPKKGKYNLYDDECRAYDEAAREKKKRDAEEAQLKKDKEEKEARLKKEQAEKDLQILTLQKELEELRKQVKGVKEGKEREVKTRERQNTSILDVFSSPPNQSQNQSATSPDLTLLQSLRESGLLNEEYDPM